MSQWFEGRGQIACSIRDVKRSIENLGEHYVEVVRLMPGLTSVELVDRSSTSVTIKTNEGLMKRTNIATHVEDDRVILECDEVYEAGSKVTAKTHFRDEFAASDSGVAHHIVMSDVEATGVLGFFYRTFGRSSMGNAFLAAHKAYFENRSA